MDGVVFLKGLNAVVIQCRFSHQFANPEAIEAWIRCDQFTSSEIVDHLVVVNGRQDGSRGSQVCPGVLPKASAIDFCVFDPVLIQVFGLGLVQCWGGIVGVDGVAEFNEEVEFFAGCVRNCRIRAKLTAPVASRAKGQSGAGSDRGGGGKSTCRGCTCNIDRPIEVFGVGGESIHFYFDGNQWIGDGGDFSTRDRAEIGCGGIFKRDVAREVAASPQNGGVLGGVSASNAVEQRLRLRLAGIVASGINLQCGGECISNVFPRYKFEVGVNVFAID